MIRAALLAIACAACSRGAVAQQPPADEARPTAFAVEVHGHGRAVIFIPGLGCPGSIWHDVAMHFDAAHYETHVLTLAGFAGQPRIDGPLAKTTRDELAGYIRAHHLERPIVIGHSLGGFIAYWLAADEPELVGPTIVVDAGAAIGDDREALAAQAAQVRDMWSKASDDQFRDQVHTIFGSMAQNRDRLAPFLDDIARSDRAAIGDAIYELYTTDVRPELPNIHAPVLAVLADGSEQVQFRAQAGAVPNHRVVVVPNAGHFVMLDDPDQFETAVDGFLAAEL
ncbi:MAG TPA: alpha/beta hydrolase [Kofleriaceae bacterium]|jgi:pimeloyl-ACP methyl ester carboxylesterase|nr:alpha/beta hydrolase [Kofleriaceae bacterium]